MVFSGPETLKPQPSGVWGNDRMWTDVANSLNSLKSRGGTRAVTAQTHGLVYDRFCTFLYISVCFCLFLTLSVHFFPFLYVSVRFCPFVDCFGIGTAIRTRQEIQCLSYAGFFCLTIRIEIWIFSFQNLYIKGFSLKLCFYCLESRFTFEV